MVNSIRNFDTAISKGIDVFGGRQHIKTNHALFDI